MTSAIKLRSGTYGLGNWYIDCPWKKIVEGKRKFDSVINSCCGNDTDYLTHELLDFLSDDTRFVSCTITCKCLRNCLIA